MRPFITAALLAGLWLTAAVPARAQGESSFLEIAPANRLSPRLPDLTVRHLSYRNAGPECPQNILTVDFYYPQGFARPEINALIEAEVEADFDERLSGVDQAFCDRELCGEASCGQWPVEKTFSVFTPSRRYASVLFTEESYTGGAHGNLDFEVLNFDLEQGRAMTLTDLFPRPDQSVPAYWRYVYAEWCRARGLSFPPHFKTVEECRPEAPPQLTDEARAEVLEDLGRLVFTAPGATLLLGPYESGSYASGAQALDIPKEDLLEMGANPGLWSN